MTPVPTSRLAMGFLLLGVPLVGLGRVALLPPFEGYDETGHYAHVAGTAPAHGDPMSAETEDDGRLGPTPPSAGRRRSHAALADALIEAKAAARAPVAGPSADPRWRSGTSINREALVRRSA